MRYMLDTNICIYLLSGRYPQLLQRVSGMQFGHVFMSMVTYAELRVGIETDVISRLASEHVLGLFLQRIPALPIDHAIAETYARLRAAVPSRKRDAFDRLIAAHAVSLNLTLVTNNTDNFTAHPGLKIEN